MLDAAVPTIAFFMVLQSIAAALRVYVRLFMLRRFGWDDAAMLVTLVLATAFGSMLIVVYFETKLLPIHLIPPEKLQPALRVLLALMVTYIAASIWLKVALGLLLQRVLVKNWQRRIIYGTMFICILYGTSYFFLVLFECGSPAAFSIRIIQTSCLGPMAISGTSYTHAALNALADLTFLGLPIALLWKADMDRRSKISVGFILGIGSVGGICTVVRIPYIETLTVPAEDFFANCRIIAIMSVAELSIGITCMCLSTLKPLVHAIFPYSDRYYYSSERNASHRQTDRLTTHGEEMSTVSSWRSPRARQPGELETIHTINTLASSDHCNASSEEVSTATKSPRTSTRESHPISYPEPV